MINTIEHYQPPEHNVFRAAVMILLIVLLMMACHVIERSHRGHERPGQPAGVQR